MAENDTKKEKAEVLQVKMTDGRTVGFAGKRKLLKETLIDPSKIEIDGDTLQLQAGAVSVRFDFRNGETRTFAVPLSLFAKAAGHGLEQKGGDNLASSAADPMSEDDMVVATDDLFADLARGEWTKSRAEGGGGVSGASIVIKAIMEATGLDVEKVKAYIEKRLATPLADGEKLTRRALYDSFRAEGTKTGAIIKRMESEKVKKAAKVDADAELASI